MSFTIRYSRYTYTGHCVSPSKATIQKPSIDPSYVLRNPFTPVNRRGLFRLGLAGACLQFDEHLFQFTAARPAILGDDIWTDPSLFWWNDTFYQGVNAEWIEREESPEQKTWPELVHVGTRCVSPSFAHSSEIDSRESSNRATFFPLLDQCRFAKDEHNVQSFMDTDGRDTIFLNDKYAIRAFDKVFEVSCFGDTLERSFTDEVFYGVGTVVEWDGAEHMQCHSQTWKMEVVKHYHVCADEFRVAGEDKGRW
jgi:hypothetical protein